MTITDLKKYAENMTELPDDKMTVVFTREGITYIGSFLKARIDNIRQALSDPKVSDKKRAKREYELNMLQSAYDSVSKATKICESMANKN